MKRKQWLASILALALLLSLVPAFSASASGLDEEQILEDGIYYIRNRAFQNFLRFVDKRDAIDNDFMDDLPMVDGLFVICSDCRKPNYDIQNPITGLDARFLWRVRYVGEGRYSISSVYNARYFLAPNQFVEENENSVVCAKSTNRGNVFSDGSIAWQWTILKDQRGYMLQSNSQLVAMLKEDRRENDLCPYLDRYNNDLTLRWEFIPAPDQILFYSNGGFFEEESVRFVAPEQTLTLEELGLNVMLSPDFNETENITWSYSDDNPDPDAEDIAWVDSDDGSVTGVRYGECTITASYTKNGKTISKSYTLKVAPLPEGDYFISNEESNALIDSVWDSNIYPKEMYLSNEHDGMRHQKWTLVHVEKDKYYILMDNLEPEFNLFYLSPAEGQTQEYGAPIVIRLVREDSVIPCWTIGVTEDGTYTIKNSKDETLLIRQTVTDDEDGEELQQGAATADDHYDEWSFERANTLRVQVYYDDYVAAYIPDDNEEIDKTEAEQVIGYIKENHLAETQRFYWERYKVSIDFLHPTLIDTYYDECEHKSYEGICECTIDSECENSTDPSDPNGLGEHHHTNISNILLRVPQPEPPVDLTVLFIGHTTCYVSPERHLWRSYKGLIFKEYGLIAVNNIGTCPCRTDGHCTCGGLSGVREYSVKSSIKTLIHEIGHFFGALDHYGDGLQDAPTSNKMGNRDPEKAELYDKACIYGEEKEEPCVLNKFMLCEACGKNITEGVKSYFGSW